MSNRDGRCVDKLLFLALLAAGLASARTGAAASDPVLRPTFDARDRYQETTLENWRVLISKRFQTKENQLLRGRVLELLHDHLYRIGRVVPAAALARLRAIPVWVEVAEPHHPCMCYHVSAGWLRAHDMNPEKARSVEIANARNFLKWTREQPWMVLHELAHGYHHQVLKFDNPEIIACYQRAVASKLYETVLHWDGHKVRHYALTNPTEYFAESTEAYFGTNDFYPFVRPELKQHDPRMYALLEKLWGVEAEKGAKP